MRNLYMYYKRLKGFIDKKQAALKKAGTEESTQVSRSNSKASSQGSVAGSGYTGGLSSDHDSHGEINMQMLAANRNDRSQSADAPSHQAIDLNASFISKNNILSMVDVPRRIAEIKQERKELRVKLDQF